MESVFLQVMDDIGVKGNDKDKLLALVKIEFAHAAESGGENLLVNLPLGFGETARLIRRAGEMPLYFAKIVALWYHKRGVGPDKVKAVLESECGLTHEREFTQLVWEALSVLPDLGLDEKSLAKAEIMQEAYRKGYKNEQVFMGCAQCTVATTVHISGRESPEVFRAANGFAAGMSQMGDGACGGYSGGLLSLGLFAGRRREFFGGDAEEKELIMVMSRKLREKFIQTYGSCICHDIHEEIFGRAFHLTQPGEREAFEAAGAHTLDKCTAVVGAAAAWVAEILFDQGFLPQKGRRDTGKAKKVVIVGGVAGGAACAARLRRLDENCEIIMFEKDEFISFANCGLPYHVGGSIAERSRLIIQTPEAMRQRFRIDVRNHSEVVQVDTEAKTVRVKSAERGEYTESYDALVLSPGAEPTRVPFEANAPERVFTLRNIPDTDKVMSFLNGRDVKAAAVIGGGFIGVEMAENLRERGVEVTLIEAAKNILPPFDAEIAAVIEDEMRSAGVKILTGEMMHSISEGDDCAIIKTKSGKEICTDFVVSAIGVTPSTGFLAGTGIELGPRGHIVTDERMLTNVADVYAVGDAISVRDFVTGEAVSVPLASPAAKQGRIVADRIHGLDHRYGGTQGTAVIKVFSQTAACTGASERTLKRLGLPYTAIYTHPFSHATYYPGAAQMSCKLIFDPTGKILGCQIVGAKGAEKRLDVVATAMRLGAKVTDLCELELSYAPPFSSAKDPVNILGYIAQNILEGNANLVDYNYMLAAAPERTILLDVRTPGEFARGHVEGALNIPVDELRERLGELDKDKEIIEYCQVGLRGHVAERILASGGFEVKNVSGGWKTISSMEGQ
ncbi:MAG: FAD-dependent oxidoreductase [Oscillospiraceae bacterium]|nr:FAD-dependent oxidoreductase [Oscillospiraceae bacterium]